MDRDQKLQDVLKRFEGWRRRIKDNVYSPVDWGGQSGISYGDIVDDIKGDYLELPFATFSDYSGATVECSNQRVFFGRYGEGGDSQAVKELFGRYGTRGIIIKLDLATESMLDDILDLDNYPLLDEEDLSMLESDLQAQCIDDLVDYLAGNTGVDHDIIAEIYYEYDRDHYVDFICENYYSAYMYHSDEIEEHIKNQLQERGLYSLD